MEGDASGEDEGTGVPGGGEELRPGGEGGVHVAVSLGLFIDRVLARGFSGLPASGFLVSG